MHPVVNIALRAALSAGDVLARAMERPDRITIIKRERNGPVTNVDRDAENTLLHHLRKTYPDYSVQSRFSGYSEGRDTRNTWLIDPIDGRENFLRGLPDFCVSVALQSGSRVSHAVIVNPLLNEAFTATHGSGAQREKQRLRVNRQETLSGALVALDAEAQADTLLPLQRELLAAQALPRLRGSRALDLVAVAAGRLDAGWCSQADSATLAAALLILQESGALISDEHGNPNLNRASELVFGTPRCFKHLLKLRQSVPGH